MKHRFTENEMLAAALAMGLISAGIDFYYQRGTKGYHLTAYTDEIPESCEPEKWSTEPK